MTEYSDNMLGNFLKSRRERLDPVALGFPTQRRRTPGLRREEVASRANISPTWYTWLEQGRGGRPSSDVLERLVKALMLTKAEREHLYMLGLGHLPEQSFAREAGVSPRLQRLIDMFDICPALVKTLTWDVVAWNKASTLLFTDYGSVPVRDRNILRVVFGNPRVKESQHDWEGLASYLVSSFRADVARANVTAQSACQELIAELCSLSDDFNRLWQQNDVNFHGEGTKRFNHGVLGEIELEFSSFSVSGRPDLDMIVYNPVKRDDADRIRALLAQD